MVTKSHLTKGTVAFKSPKSKKTSVTIPAAVKYKGVTYKVTSIYKNAFKNNKKLKKVVIGKNVKSIGDSAFMNCKALSKVTIPSNVYKIGKNCFKNCTGLKSIIIKTKKLKKKYVGSNAFKKIYTKALITVQSGKSKSYKKILKARGISGKVKVK